jgi:prepilin signal peptidase PulO-like enzyme (type II secretory pathway)
MRDVLPLAMTLAYSVAGASLGDVLCKELAPDAPRDAPATMLLAGAAGAAALASGGDAAAAVTCSGLTVAAVLDAQSGYLVDELTLSTALLALLCAGLGGTPGGAVAAMLAVAGPACVLAFCSHGALLGWGDVKALLGLGAGLGTPHACIAVGLACASGALWATLARRREVRFGPFLAGGAVAATLLGAPDVRIGSAFA